MRTPAAAEHCLYEAEQIIVAECYALDAFLLICACSYSQQRNTSHLMLCKHLLHKPSPAVWLFSFIHTSQLCMV